MAKYRGWVSDPEGPGGLALTMDNKHVRLDSKPPPEEISKVKGAPEGQFIRSPNIDFTVDDDGFPQPIEGSDFRSFEPIDKANSLYNSLGGVIERKARLERRLEDEKMAARLGARMGGKKKLDKEGLRLGYTPSQERSRASLRDVRAKLEKGFADGQYTPQQMKQLEEQIFLKEEAILPQMIRQPPTPQEHV